MPQPINLQTVRTVRTLAEIEQAGNLEIVAIDDLKFDHLYQRDLSAALVQSMAEEYDPRVAGTITLNRRKNKELYVIDGQHRTGAAKTAGETHMLALVYEGLKPVEEAAMRVKGNVRKADNPQERFRAKLAAGDPESKAIQEICDAYGTRINFSPNMNTGINAVAAVEQAYRRDNGMLLGRVFDVLQRAFGRVDQHALTIPLRGLVWLFENNGEEVDVGRLVDRLQVEGSVGLRKKADAHQAAFGGSIWANWYRAVIEAYNVKLPESKRLDWNLPRGAGGRRESRAA